MPTSGIERRTGTRRGDWTFLVRTDAGAWCALRAREPLVNDYLSEYVHVRSRVNVPAVRTHLGPRPGER